MSKKGAESPSLAFFLFHLRGGTRLALRIFASLVAVFFALYYVVGYEFFLSFMATVLDAGFLLSGLFTFLVCFIIARFAARRIYLGICGWMRHLPAEGAIQRRMAGIAVFISQIPVLIILVLLARMAGKFLEIYALPYLVGLPLAGFSSSLFVLPAKNIYRAKTLTASAAVCLASNDWRFLAAGFVLLAAADRLSGPLLLKRKKPTFRIHLKGPFFTGTINWRALRFRILFPYLFSLPFVGATRLFLANNDVSAPLAERVTRFGGALSLAAFCSIAVHILASRRPPWPWIRSLPWPARSRILWDSAFAGLHSLPLLLILGILNLKALLPLVFSLPLLAVYSSASMRQVPESRISASGKVLFFGALGALLLFLAPLSSLLFLALTPFALKAAVRSEKRQKVSRWLELHHLAEGDSLSWSGS
jgi:hypothetical protein